MRLTDAGQVLLVRARRAVCELECAEKEIESITGQLRGPLNLGTLPMYGSKALPSWIDAFNTLYPNVRIRVRAMRADEIEAGLIAGTIDLGFSLGPPEHSQLNSEELVSDQIVLIIANDHPLAQKKSLQAADFENLPLALPSNNISSTRAIGGFFEAINISPNVVSEHDDGHSLLELAKLGGLATLLPKAVLHHYEGLTIIPLPEPGVPISVAAMWTQLNPTTSAFLNLVRAKNAAAHVSDAQLSAADAADDNVRHKTKTK